VPFKEIVSAVVPDGQLEGVAIQIIGFNDINEYPDTQLQVFEIGT